MINKYHNPDSTGPWIRNTVVISVEEADDIINSSRMPLYMFQEELITDIAYVFDMLERLSGDDIKRRKE